MTAAGETNWCEFARAILAEASGMSPDVPWFKAATDGRPLTARQIIPISTREYPALAVRPRYSVLSNAQLAQTFACALPDWRTQLCLVFSESEHSSRA